MAVSDIISNHMIHYQLASLQRIEQQIIRAFQVVDFAGPIRKEILNKTSHAYCYSHAVLLERFI